MFRKHLQDFSKGNLKRTGLFGSIYDFGVDCDDIAVNDTLDIDKYLMKKNGII